MYQHFNTSYVVIKRSVVNILHYKSKDFNTSYVVIKQLHHLKRKLHQFHFNTSYVVIKPAKSSKSASKYSAFQYILCCY